MTNPWDGPRHRSWASNTVLTFLLLVICIIATVVSDYIGEPPNYLVGLLGTAAGAFFAAIGSDKQKKDQEVASTARDAQQVAHRAEAKADAGLEVAKAEHPEKLAEAEQGRASAEEHRVLAEDERVEAEVQRRLAEERRKARELGGEGG
ncbi:membrane protein [Mycobacterium phage PenguinLover67]|nr:membrane protein [Mycobacterium phage PenguinLover67]